ncbi:hypothetical protein GIB67_021619 [Kingdonia uniflora]|uniref:ERCC4 domain-containing protein n=1 Tax=Kingdonia uniflora TaxID=39325 RepID=A0A7J7ME26_9MAGN|nr:hypothetical protein GIB67_021619 [Kingdonia uniflora]
MLLRKWFWRYCNDKDGLQVKDYGGGSSTHRTSLKKAFNSTSRMEVLEEIEEERQKQILQNEGDPMVENLEVDDTIVLVACKDERSCMQLEDCITKGPRQAMREEWEKYLLCKAELHGIRSRTKKKSKEPKGVGILNGAVPAMPRENADAGSINKLERDVLLAAASELSSIGKEDIVIEELQDGKSKSKGADTKCSKFLKKSDISLKRINDGKSEIYASENEFQKGVTLDKRVLQKHKTEVNTGDSAQSKPLPPVHFYALESHEHILDVLRPSVIIVYHPDMSFVREVEIYKAENSSMKVKVYFLFYEDSTEVQKFEASIRKENGAFESLIRQKSLMMIPVDQDGRGLGLEAASTWPEALNLQNSVTRKAGGRKEMEKEMQVIVDTREFMSSLPNVLHQKGMRIIPVKLEVGDYVLSPLICVERKSISDLYQSFASGRLYNQVETMMRNYRIPVLLIEFSQDKSFSFQSASEVGDDVTNTNIISKLSLLVLHFPRLRLIWSRSLHATAEIFASLKANQDEPDETKAMKVGVPTEEGLVENDARAEIYNTSAVEFLRRLPGVSDSNYRALMDGCNSLAELALLPAERLAELMGGQVAARTLRDFLDAKYPTLL